MSGGALLRGVLAVAGLALASAPAHAEALAVGDVLLCPSGAGRAPVLAWVGRIERWADHGVTGASAQVALVHLQLQMKDGGPLDRAAHAPFEATALNGCDAVEAAGMRVDAAAFEDGYGVWRDAVRNGAGAFTLPSADAFYAVIDARDGAMGS